MCRAFYRANKGDRALTTYFIDFKKTYEELNMLLPFSSDVTVQQTQQEKMVMNFLAGLSSEYETTKSQILSGTEISSLQEVFSRVIHTESSPTVQLAQPNSAFMTRCSSPARGKQQNRNGGNKSLGSNNTAIHGQETGDVVCHYCHQPLHFKRDC